MAMATALGYGPSVAMAAAMAKAKAFIESPEYAPVKQMRMDNSTGTLVIVEGC